MRQRRLFKWIILILILVGIGSIVFLQYHSHSNVPDPMEEATSVTAISDEDQALQTLTDFLSLLQSKEYESAELLFGGSYDMLIGYNPDLDPADHAALLERACEVNGLKLFKVKNSKPRSSNLRK